MLKLNLLKGTIVGILIESVEVLGIFLFKTLRYSTAQFLPLSEKYKEKTVFCSILFYFLS